MMNYKSLFNSMNVRIDFCKAFLFGDLPSVQLSAFCAIAQCQDPGVASVLLNQKEQGTVL